MYYALGTVLRKRLLLELQDSFAMHPVYRKIVPFIENKFNFKSRPQMGIVVKGASGNKVQLDPSNFVGTIVSHVMLAYVGQPSYPIEWVREDAEIVRRAGGMPTAPGVYYVQILSAPTQANEPGFFAVDPLLTQRDEAVLLFQLGTETEAQLQHAPIPNTIRLYLNGRILLIPGRDYTINMSTGTIQFKARFFTGDRVTADYRYAGTSLGPIPFYWNHADHTTLPGVVLAFGKRAEEGQKVAVVVYSNRVETAQAYGGKFEASFDVDVISRDTHQTEEIADLVFMYLFGEKKARLELEGIEILDVSQGGESEEPADEAGDLNFYIMSMTVQLRADWEIHVPLPLTMSRVTEDQDNSDNPVQGIRQVQNRIFFDTAPILVRKNNDFERIG